jgi:tetratricopeptide (TPR) repeat protein
MYMGKLVEGWDACDRAIEVAADRSANERVSILARIGEGSMPRALLYRRDTLERAIAELDGEATPEACRLLALIAAADPSPSGDEAAVAAAHMANTLGLTGLGLPPSLRLRPMWAAFFRGDFERARLEAEQVDQRLLGPWQTERLYLGGLCVIGLYSGDIARLIPAAHRMLDAARRWGDANVERVWATALDRIDWLQNGIPKTRSEFEAAIDGAQWPRAVAARQALEQGEPELAVRLVPHTEPAGAVAVAGGPARWEGVSAAALLAVGDVEAARAVFERWVLLFDQWPGLQERAGALAAGGDVVCALAHKDLLRRVADYLEEYSGLRYWPPTGTGADHLRGAVALRLDQVDLAARHFQAGLQWARQPDVRFWLDEARCLQGLGEVAEHQGDHAAAMRHLDSAGELFAKHGAKFHLEQVLAKKEILRA